MARLTRDDWTGAALQALATGGAAAVAVEPLAATLHTTKGSFYWHFASRLELLEAALQQWQRSATDDVIAEIDAHGGTPADRLAALFATVLGRTSAGSAGSVDLALLGALGEPLIAEAVDRVTARRVDYIAGLLRACGQSRTKARRRAVFAYAAYLGHLQLRAARPGLFERSVGSPDRYRAEVVAALLEG